MKHWLHKLLPAPLLSLALLGMWLLLNRSLSAGHVLLGGLLALAIPVLTAGLRPTPVRIRRPGAVLRLMLTVMADTVQSTWPSPDCCWRPGGVATRPGLCAFHWSCATPTPWPPWP